MKLQTILVALSLIVLVHGFRPLEFNRINNQESKRSVEGVQRACTASVSVCTTVGKACGFTGKDMSEYSACANSFCLYNYTESISVGKCTAFYGVGADCPNGNECSNSATCLDSKCATVTYARTAGQDCDDARQCAGSLECYPSSSGGYTCVNGASASQSCESVPCAFGLDCNDGVSPAICVVLGSVASGAACSDTDQCGAGYYCSSGSPGVCTKASASSNKACDSSLDCTVAGEDCDCAAGAANSTCTAPSTNTQKELDLLLAAENCFVKNNCGENTIYSTCNCKSQVCDYFNTILGTDALPFPKSYFPCVSGLENVLDYCSSASSLVAGGLLMVFCAFLSFF